MPYSLTFELYGSNNEGKRLADWKLPANRGGTGRRSTLALAAAGGEEEDWEEQGEDWAGGGAAGALALGAEAAGSGLGGRTMGARRSLEAFDCLVQFNPSTLHEYRGVVAGCATAVASARSRVHHTCPQRSAESLLSLLAGVPIFS